MRIHTIISIAALQVQHIMVLGSQVVYFFRRHQPLIVGHPKHVISTSGERNTMCGKYQEYR